MRDAADDIEDLSDLPMDLIEALEELGCKGNVRKIVLLWLPLSRTMPMIDQSKRGDH